MMNRSDLVKKILSDAEDICNVYNNRYMGPEHILFGLLSQESFADVYEHFGADAEDAMKYLEDEVFFKAEKKKTQNPATCTSDYNWVIGRAEEMAKFNGGNTIIATHLALALLELNDCVVSCYLESELDISDFRTAVAHMNMGDEASFNKKSIDGDMSFGSMDPLGGFLGLMFGGMPGVKFQMGNGQANTQQQKNDGLKNLSKYGTCLNEKEFKPVIGRDNEIALTCRTLARKDKCNPIHVGEPGVGKTAIVHGLIQKIKDGTVPEQLKDAIIYEISMGSLVAGTKYRGEFEDRLKGIITDAISDKNIILYIDEIHQLIGAGAVGSGSMDGAQILKPYLQDGSIRCIGATTYDEYKKHIETDSALQRRFKKIDVKEPSEDEAIQIMEGLKETYETHHNVVYTEEALKAAVCLSKKYMTEKFLPDKAIDLIDEAGAYVNQENLSDRTVGEDLIQSVLAEACNIPPATVGADEQVVLRNLDNEMKKFVYGQDKAIDALVESVIISRAGLTNENKPMGTYLFVGPTGTGKTEVAKQLADKLHLDFIRYNMSEYMEKHTASKLIGAPSGYVGYDEGGLLTEDIRKHPYCVLLLDEFEKAHEDVYNIFLQVMDDATLTDNKGRTADFRNVIIIMTSNAGASSLGQKTLGFGSVSKDESVMIDAVNKTFTPEFRNRLTDTIMFNSMSPDMANLIAEKQLNILKNTLATKGITLNAGKDIVDAISAKVQKPEYGGREIVRIVDKDIKPLFAKPMVLGDLKNGDTCTLVYQNDKFEIQY